MRNIILFLSAILLISSCRDNTGNALFEMKYDVNFTISPGLAPIITHIYTIDDISTSIAEYLETNNLTEGEIISINTNFARVYDVFGVTNLNFVDKIEVNLFDPESPNVSWPAAIEDPVLQNVDSEIKIFPAVTDFKDILTNDKFGMQIKLRLRDISPEEIECRLELTMAAKEE